MSRHQNFRPILPSYALALALLASALPSSAQSSGASADGARAEELLTRGAELRQSNQDTEALALFRRALELQPDSCRALAHLGTTYQALGRWVLADTYLTQALAHSDDSYVQRHREALEQAEAFVKDRLGLLEVKGGPPGAEIQINGQRLATLPMSEPVRVPVGSYQMEVTLQGHYSFSEPIRITSRALTRETVELLPLSAGARPATIPVSSPAGGGGDGVAVGREQSSVPAWLPWTLAGLGTGAAVVSTIAWIQRQNHADRWNDDSVCLNVGGATRQSLCGSERTRGLRDQTIAIATGGAALVLATAAIWTALAGGTESPAQAGLESCGLELTGLQCAGRF